MYDRQGGGYEVSMRWVVKGIPLKNFNDEGGSVGEPFAHLVTKSGASIVLTKEAKFYEGDEDRSSEKHPQMERERG
jgi:hypothetical protein